MNPSNAVPSRMPSSSAAPAKVGFVSLGCPKALVDSERILSTLRAEGYIVAPTYAGADVVVVNTCGFLNSAREESLGAIGEAMAENGRVIVTGCLGTDAAAIRDRFPNVLAVTGPHQYEAVVGAVHDAAPPLHDPRMDLLPPGGIKLTPRHYAYLKISEGCNHRCSFCIIPHLRGDLVSRPIDAVLQEAERLAQAGVRELMVISQDTSAYGVDRKYEPRTWRNTEYPTRFVDLGRGLSELGIWIRLHYVYPYPHVDEVIPLMADHRILPYLDIPFQHGSARILKLMKRPAADVATLDRIKAWRRLCPDLTLRSTFIVGFPGETDEDFDTLLDWLEEADLDRVGCFKYEPVDGAPANALPDPVPEEVKEHRFHRFMSRQQEISEKRLAQKIGREMSVIVDEVDDQGAIARSMGDAPEIDGCVFLNGTTHVQPGEILQVRIDHSDEYDLWASPLKSSAV